MRRLLACILRHIADLLWNVPPRPILRPIVYPDSNPFEFVTTQELAEEIRRRSDVCIVASGILDDKDERLQKSMVLWRLERRELKNAFRWIRSAMDKSNEKPS